MDSRQIRPMVAVAGASGDLGTRIVGALAAIGASVGAMERQPIGRTKLHGLGNDRYGKTDWTSAATVLAPTL